MFWSLGIPFKTCTLIKLKLALAENFSGPLRFRLRQVLLYINILYIALCLLVTVGDTARSSCAVDSQLQAEGRWALIFIYKGHKHHFPPFPRRLEAEL
jgi:hypothetical protein